MDYLAQNKKLESSVESTKFSSLISTMATSYIGQ